MFDNSQPLLEVTCPRCCKRTDRVQSCEVTLIVFIVLYIAWNDELIEGCPKCVRRRLWQLFWLELFAANVFFVFVGPFLVVHLIQSHRHDYPGIPDRYADWANLEPTPPQIVKDRWMPIRVVVVLAILAAVIGGVFFVLPRFVN